ncbi:uncharacterized protein ACA1_123820 [Acanthamoeba castellanii str. Neff]|uniref:Uncharacterized protein n=1 Tax=Acanthamoeba castellanii (strain ATCC 30010 / Neff) TaxID=1257118 RepID=L8HGL8_ACACF|nr:uncharacterized protein ACA1_123820 [Acanthamoeba castellanii str. Neff]ELR23863.1 hypothetical protein ACA1_123820 [Acanthamoeba castellanii str. Neff]
MKHSVDAMKKDVSRLSAKQRTYTNMQHDLTQRLDSLPAIVPPMAPARSELLVPRPTDSARAARLEFLRQFPFLERYNLATRDVPFIVDDLRKPFAILRFLPATHWERGVPLPIMVYASASFCELTQYELHELQGCPPVHLGVPDRTQHGQLIQNITHRTYADITDTIQVHPLMRTKNGNIIKTTLRHQAFFDDDGDVRARAP